MIFVEAPQSVEEIERIAREVEAPLLINLVLGGMTPLESADPAARTRATPSRSTREPAGPRGPRHAGRACANSTAATRRPSRPVGPPNSSTWSAWRNGWTSTTKYARLEEVR